MNKKETGFTIAEVLVSLLVLMTVLVILLPLMGHFSPESWKNEWGLLQFSQVLQEELNTSTTISHTTNVLYFENEDGETVSIEQYQDAVRRRVNGLGHEILLYDIETIRFTLDPGILAVQADLKGGGTYEKTFFVPE